MVEHNITVIPSRKMDAHGNFHKWKCSCGKIGNGTFGFKGQAESAGLDHAKAKSAQQKGHTHAMDKHFDVYITVDGRERLLAQVEHRLIAGQMVGSISQEFNARYVACDIQRPH